ncbi:MAG: anaerobic sulfatase maturase [Clostridia bacterium]|nr:anaerobic sulfatase maturase [Clostridia bacterium]
MPPLSIMIKPVSGMCDLRCRYCFYADVSAHREKASFGRMREETAHALIRRAFMYADDSITFAFQGGEPTLAGIDFYERFVSLVREYNTRGLRVAYSLQTNGCGLTDAFCAFFAKHDFLVGVSLDGTRETHNAARVDAMGEGSYDRVICGIRLLQKHKVECNILCVVTEAVAKAPKAVWQTLAPYGYIQFIPCIDAFDGEKSTFSLSAKSYGEFLIAVYDLYEAAFLRGSPVSERRFDNYLSMLLGRMPEHCGMAGQCGLYFLVEADGGVYPCDFYVLDAWRAGNICETSFARLAKTECMTAFRQMSLQKPSACRDCAWLHLCRGGCRRDREQILGEPLGENRFCESYRMLFAARGARMAALADKVAKIYK